MKVLNKISAFFLSAIVLTSGIALTSCSDDAIDTNPYNKDGVNVIALGPCPLTRGDNMRITGTKLNKVAKVQFPQGSQLVDVPTEYLDASFTVTNDNEMTVVVPDQTIPGHIHVITKDGETIESEATVTFVEQVRIDACEHPAVVRAGDVLTIKGEFVWNIATLVFADNVVVEAVDFLAHSRNEVKVAVPQNAQTGEVYFTSTKADERNGIVCENLVIRPAALEPLAKVDYEFGDEVTIMGTDLDLVEAVTFPKVDAVPFTVAPDGKSIKVNVPQTAVNGQITLIQYSGLVVKTEEISLPLATVESATPNEDLNVGDVVTLTGTHLDRIVKVVLPGDVTLEKGDFTQSETEISFTVPEGMGDGKATLVQHDNYSIESPKLGMHHEGSEYPIWTGSKTIGNWDGSMDALAWDGGKELWPTVQEGQVMSIYISRNEDADWAQLRVGNGSWAALPGTSDPYDIEAGENIIRITLTQAMLDVLVNEGGLVLCGANWTVTKVTLSALEQTVWEGEQSFADGNAWSNQPYIGAQNAEDFIAAGAKEGSKVNFYLDVVTDDWQLQVHDGNWGGQFEAFSGIALDDNSTTVVPVADGKAVASLTLTKDMFDKFAAHSWAGGTFVLQGQGCVLTKVTVAP